MLLSNIKKQILGFEDGWKTERLEETLCSLSFQLPNFKPSNSYEDQKRKFNIQTCFRSDKGIRQMPCRRSHGGATGMCESFSVYSAYA